MKKIILTAALFAFTLSAKAQGFYTSLDFGYGFGTSTTNLGKEEYKDFSFSGENTSYEKQLYGTVGGGLNMTVTPGYMISKNIGVELGINYFMGANTLVQKMESSLDGLYKNTHAHSNQLRIIPSVVINTGGEKLYGYAKAGLVLPVYGSTKGIVQASQYNSGAVEKIDVETTTKGNISLGFRGALGIGYQFTKLISLNFEVYHTSLTVKPKSRTIDSYKINGVEVKDQLNTYSNELEIEYVDKIDNTSNNQGYNPNYDPNKAKNDLPTKANFSQFGFSLGVKFSF